MSAAPHGQHAREQILAAILERDSVQHVVADVTATSGRSLDDVRAELAADLREMIATHGGRIGDVFVHFARVFDRTAYRDRIRYDRARLAEIRRLAEQYPVAVLPSHRSYLDPIVLASVLQREGIDPTFKLGGINVAFWPMGSLGRRAGLIFIRRSFRDDRLYKLALREYVGWLAEHRCHLEWYIEGGRSRTGKLREPRLGLLAYLVDAVRDDRCADFLLLPTSIVYDELLDVEEHVRSASGAAKRPESLGRLVDYARAQRTRYARGDIHLTFGEAISVREYLARADAGADSDRDRDRDRDRDTDSDAGELPLRKLAFEVAVRINDATPVTPPALITTALLWADRALTVDQLLLVLGTYAGYVRERALPVTAASIDEREIVTSGLDALERHGVVTRYDGGREPVFLIQSEQRVAASYHRNSIIHFFVLPALVDLAIAATEDGSDRTHDAALHLRDLMKFEFFFAERAQFLADVDAELARAERPVTGPLLRPFLEAYWVTADALAAHGVDPVDDPGALTSEACALGEQYLLQRRIYCADAVSSSYVEGAARLAAHRGLLDGDDLAARRAAFAEELHAFVRRARTTQTWAARSFLELMREPAGPSAGRPGR